MAKYSISSLIKTGFSRKRIRLICYDDNHSIYFKNKYGIRSETCDTIPKEFDRMFKREDTTKKYFFYKPIAFYYNARKPIGSDTITAYSDIDALFIKDPTKYILSKKTDVWTAEGTSLPITRKRDPSKLVKKPEMTYDSLKEFYWKCGGGALAHLHLKYKWKINNKSHYTGCFAIKPNVHTSLIDRWYEMCKIAVQRDDHEKGDQEIFSAAIWSLSLSHGRSPKRSFRKKFCKMYECGKKKNIKKDYNKIMKKK